MSQLSLKFDHETKGWADLIPRRNPQSNLTSNIDTRWLVIGAGFTGLSCARRLAELNPSDKNMDVIHTFHFYDIRKPVPWLS